MENEDRERQLKAFKERQAKAEERLQTAIELSESLRDFLLKEIMEYIEKVGDFDEGHRRVHMVFDPDEERGRWRRAGKTQYKPPFTYCSNYKVVVTRLMHDHVVYNTLNYQRKDFMHQEGFVMQPPSRKMHYGALPVSVLLLIFFDFYGESTYGRPDKTRYW